MTYIPVSGHKQSIARWKDSRAWKNSQLHFSSYGNVTYFWARNTFREIERERERILIGSSQRYTFTLLRVFFFSFFFFLLPRSETVESDYDTRENPNSFWNGQFPLEESEKNEFRGESDKNISWYINRFDIECNNRKEYSFFFIVVCAFIYHYTIRYYYKNKRIEGELLLSCDTIRLCPPVITV